MFIVLLYMYFTYLNRDNYWEMYMFKKISIKLVALLVFTGCFQGKSDNNVSPIDTLKAYLVKNYSTLKISPMAEAFAGLVSNPAKQKEIIDKAKASYVEMNIQEIYLLTATNAENNESVIGSLIHFNDSLTLEEAQEQLEKDSNFENQALDIYMNKNFAFVVATINGKRVTPKSIITAFKNFK